MILVEHGPQGAALFSDATERVVVRRAEDLSAALARLDGARAQGKWVAGWIAYEAGYALEPRLAGLMPEGQAPLFGLWHL